MWKRLGLFLASWLLVLLAACQGISGNHPSGSSSLSTGCTDQTVNQVVQHFIDAFNRGDFAQLDQLVSDQRFGWYSTDAPGERLNAEAADRSTLMAYFAARHRQHERLVLTWLNVTFTNAGAAGFWFRVTRSADDGLPPTTYNGKGEIQCGVAPSNLVVWAMDPAPWWPPYELLPEAVLLILIAAGIVSILLWRRRTATRLGQTGRPASRPSSTGGERNLRDIP